MDSTSKTKPKAVKSRSSMANLRSMFRKKEAPAPQTPPVDQEPELESVPQPQTEQGPLKYEPEFPSSADIRRVTNSLLLIMDQCCSGDFNEEAISLRAQVLADTLIKYGNEGSITHTQMRSAFGWALDKFSEKMKNKLKVWENDVELIEMKEKWDVAEKMFTEAEWYLDEAAASEADEGRFS